MNVRSAQLKTSGMFRSAGLRDTRIELQMQGVSTHWSLSVKTSGMFRSAGQRDERVELQV
jgi:hypothetical protein